MFRYIIASLSLFFITLNSSASVVVYTDPVAAFASAKAENKKVLLVFQGSDWCLPCIKLEKNVLSTDSFLNFAAKNLVILKADFPQRKKIEPALASAYEKLAGNYNKEGRFPKLVLVDPGGKQLAVIETRKNQMDEVMNSITAALKQYNEQM